MNLSKIPPDHFNPLQKSHSLIEKFGFAFCGIIWTIKTQINMRIHLLATSIVVIIGSLLHISAVEWCLIIFCCTLVLSLETINSSLEEIVDHISPEYKQFAKHAKDAAAGAVLLAALGSLLVGMIIFLPRIIILLITSQHYI